MPDQGKFVEIIKANEGLIYKITSVYCRDVEDQKDLYQEIVYQLWKSFGSFAGKSKISTWIYRVALNTAITYKDKLKKKVAVEPLGFEIFNQAGEMADPEKREMLRIMYQMIERLNDLDKALILLFLEGKSYDEIAEISGFTPTNIGTRLNRIRQKLKTQNKSFGYAT